MIEAIKSRRSVRSFTEVAPGKKQIEEILHAGMQAPSAANQQPWRFIVVQTRELLDRLSEMSPYASSLKQAPTAIIVHADTSRLKFPQNWQQDMGACVQNMLLQIVEEGLAAVWLGVYPEQERESLVKSALDIQGSVFAVIALGYADGAGNTFTDRWDTEKVEWR
jgi:nitroreductase